MHAAGCALSVIYFEAKRSGQSRVTLEQALNVSPPRNINHFGNIDTAASILVNGLVTVFSSA
jgi:hypothetical protein